MPKVFWNDCYDEEDFMEDYSQRPQKITRPLGTKPKVEGNFKKSRKETFRKQKRVKREEHKKLEKSIELEKE